jgi:hypothetical protein
MKEKKIKVIKNNKGFFSFYIGNKDITELWMDFFSSLSIKQERECVTLFIKKYYGIK